MNFRPRAIRLRTALVAVAVGALGSGLLVPAAQAAPASTSAVVAPAIPWAPCRGGFECARVEVPLDYDDPRGTQIEVQVIRLRATRPDDRIGSLLVNPGGPGGSGVDFVRFAGHVLPAELRARFDIVGFDPRGTNRSTPLFCFRTFDEALRSLPRIPFPDDVLAQERAYAAADDALAAACTRRGNAIRDHMSSADAARDMDVLRRSLGDRKLNFLGFSYGSILGQNYANLFPGKVRALVIDGVLDPIAWSTGRDGEGRTIPFTDRLASAAGAAATLGEFFRLCDAAGPDCALSGDARERYAAVAAQLRRHPATITDPGSGETFRFTYNDLVAITLGSLYAPESWPFLAEFLADLERQIAPSALGQRLSAVRTALGLATPRQQPYPNFVEAFPGVACSDSVNPRSFATWRSTADRAEQAFGRFGRTWHWTGDPCRSWPTTAGDDRYTGPWTARTSSPVLVVGNFFDPATPHRGAVTASRLLPNSRLLSYAGWGHTAYLSAGNSCVDAHVTRYLLTARVPAAGTVCRPEGSPFDTATGAAAASAAATAPALRREVLPPVVRSAFVGG